MKNDYKLKTENIIKQVDANEFMGIKIENGAPKLYVPLTFRISDDDKQRSKDILLFLRSLSLAFKDKEYIREYNMSQSDQWPIDSYLWIIRDYLENGIYRNREKIYKNGNYGKTDWKRTIRKAPIFSNGNLIYIDTITTKMSPTNDLISYAYKYCLNISTKRIGWLFNYSFMLSIEKVFSIKELVMVVRNALSETFDDNKRMRYQHMLLILNNANESTINSREQTFGVRNYYYVFEKMVDIYFAGIDQNSIKKYYPHGQWNILPNIDAAIDSSELRPDTIKHVTEDKKYTYIIDAKMYKYGGLDNLKYLTEGLPETTSIQKQITYGDYIQQFVDTDRIVRNMFVLPFDKSIERFKCSNGNLEYINENIAFIGFAKGDWRLNGNNAGKANEYEYVLSFMIDFNYLLNNYMKKMSSVTFESIERVYEKRLKSIKRMDWRRNR